MATEYNASQIKSMSVNYVERMYDASQKSVTGVNLEAEFLVLKLSKADLDTLTSPTGCTGVFCILGIEGKKQTVTLVPHDASNKALPIDSSNVIKGMEDWVHGPPKLKDVIFPNNPNNEQISVGVNNVLTNLGIV